MRIIKSLFRIINKFIFILVVALIMVFCLNNHQDVTISLAPLPFEVEAKLFLIILFCFFGGILIGFLCSSLALTKEKFKNFIGGWKIKFLQMQVARIKK